MNPIYRFLTGLFCAVGFHDWERWPDPHTGRMHTTCALCGWVR